MLLVVSHAFPSIFVYDSAPCKVTANKRSIRCWNK